MARIDRVARRSVRGERVRGTSEAARTASPGAIAARANMAVPRIPDFTLATAIYSRGAVCGATDKMRGFLAALRMTTFFGDDNPDGCTAFDAGLGTC